MSEFEPGFSRRQLFQQSVAMRLGSQIILSLCGADSLAGEPELIVRESQPPNLEMPFSSLDGFITPSPKMYVRCHFPVPALSAESFSLRVEGKLKAPFSISLSDLKKLHSTTITAVMECAGNGRVHLVPKVRGVAWDQGGVGNVTWTGVPLSLILERAEIDSSAKEILLEGADTGVINDDPKTPGEIHFDRSIPLEKARKDVILAYRMNGEDLSPAHGFPLRAVVPGWYGMASVKWLTKLVVLDRSYQGYFQSIDYAYFDRSVGSPSLLPLSTMPVKAQIAQPSRFERVKRSSSVRVHGAAWSGAAPIAKVEFSDDGTQWSEAELMGEDVPNAWRLWSHTWRTPDRVGLARISVRATDKAGNTQPAQRSADRRTYMINHIIPTEVSLF